jgi:hypothetical protein
MNVSPASISTMSWTSSIAMTLSRSVPGGACSAKTIASMPTYHECSASFSRRDPSMRVLRRTMRLSLSISMTKAS